MMIALVERPRFKKAVEAARQAERKVDSDGDRAALAKTLEQAIAALGTLRSDVLQGAEP